MILYFSGTGNSRYIANILGNKLQDEVVDMFLYIKNNTSDDFYSDKTYIFVTPTYAWRTPRIVMDFIRGSKFNGNKYCYFVQTCGSETGKSREYIVDKLKSKNLNMLGFFGIKMPENYIAMFDVPNKIEQEKIIKDAVITCEEIVAKIQNNEIIPKCRYSLLDAIYSGPINPIFYKLCVNSNNFYVTDKCVSCGICEKICVMNNIEIENGKPIFSDKCTHCMACLGKCPQRAIEIKKHSEGKEVYYLS